VLELMLPGVRTVFAVDGLDAVAVALDVCPWAVDPRPRHAAHERLDAAQRLQQRMGKNLPILIAASGDYKRLREGYGVFDYSLRKPIEVDRPRPLSGASDGVSPTDRTDRRHRRAIERPAARLLALDALLARRFRAQALHAFRVGASARRLAGVQSAPARASNPDASHALFAATVVLRRARRLRPSPAPSRGDPRAVRRVREPRGRAARAGRAGDRFARRVGSRPRPSAAPRA
jgi:hypothetical protein